MHQKAMAAMKAEAGMVRIHAMTRFPATPQRTAESRLVEPTPKMQAVMVWVVLTGAPKSDAPQMTAAAEVSVAKPCTAPA